MRQQSNDNQMYLLNQMNPYIIFNSPLMNMYFNNNRQINGNQLNQNLLNTFIIQEFLLSESELVYY